MSVGTRRWRSRRLLPSGRAPTEQPNVAEDGPLALTARVWLLAVVTGVAAGLFGAALMLLLRAVQHAAFSYRPGDDFQAAVEQASWVRRIVVLAVGGAFAGVAWYSLRRTTRGGAEVDDALWTGTGELRFPRSLGTSVFAAIVIGMGASLGREAAPKQMGAASASVLARWARLTPPQRRLLVACGAGAGMAAVYNVPLGGALITAEVLYGSLTLPVVLPALATYFIGIATAVAWVYLPVRATYVDVPAYPVHPAQLGWALLAGPVIGVVSAGYVKLIGWASVHRPTGRVQLIAPLVAFTLLGVVGIGYPQLFGNGRGMAQQALLGHGDVSLFLALFALKPLVTAACLGSGASGGLFTPTLSTGAVFGGFLGIAWSWAWPGAPIGSYAVIGAAAMAGAGMQPPFPASRWCSSSPTPPTCSWSR